MKKFLIVANWKCNPVTLKDAKQLFDSVKRGLRNIKKTDVVICPPFVYLANLQLTTYNLKLGAQNCFWEQKGAFTGEISPVMLKNIGCKYIIIGHSERRRWFGETDEMINKKIKAALLAKLKPIFCLGETEKEKKEGRTFEVVKSQIEKGLNKVSKKEIKNIIIAYEPVWAIGTGSACSSAETITVVLFIRKYLNQLYSQTVSKSIPILYGGSVNKENAKNYIKEAGVNGLLVGGASLRVDEFLAIVKSIANI